MKISLVSNDQTIDFQLGLIFGQQMLHWYADISLEIKSWLLFIYSIN